MLISFFGLVFTGMFIGESKLHMLSPTGTGKMWDAAADGYARGEGVASVVLKPLSAALRDGDHVDCIIRGTAGMFFSSSPSPFSRLCIPVC
jgi:hybrid polyketide synthase/nonribosomal peptide synthetase ACE1